MASGRIRIGDMLVAAGLVTEDQVQQALEQQKESGRKLGEELVDQGFVTEVQLTQILSNQLSIPWVSLYHVQFSRELLNLIPPKTAEAYCLIPIYVRKVRRSGETLFIAMDDPTNEQALSKIRELAGLPVKPMVAPPTEIRDAIRVYYFGGKRKKSPAKAAQKKPKQKEPPPPPADAKASSESGGAAEAGPGQSGEAAQVSDGPSEAAGAGAEAASGSASESAEQPASEAREKGENRARKAATKASQKMITLTLLDGTEVRLPAARKKGGGGEEAAPASEPATGAGGMTAGDLVQALLARAEGQDTSDLLPNAQWETFFATMLTLLLRKGLIADWEFVEEWRKHQGGEQ